MTERQLTGRSGYEKQAAEFITPYDMEGSLYGSCRCLGSSEEQTRNQSRGRQTICIVLAIETLELADMHHAAVGNGGSWGLD